MESHVQDQQLANPEVAGPHIRGQAMQERQDAFHGKVPEARQPAGRHDLQGQFVVLGAAGAGQGIDKFPVGQKPAGRPLVNGLAFFLRPPVEAVPQEHPQQRLEGVGALFVVIGKKGRRGEAVLQLLAAHRPPADVIDLFDRQRPVDRGVDESLLQGRRQGMEFAVDDVVEIFPGRIGQDILPARVEIPVIAHGFRQGEHLAFAEFFVGDGRVQIRDFPVPSGALAAAEIATHRSWTFRNMRYAA